MAVFIDTQIWIFAQKAPEEARYQDPSDLESAREIFTAAHEFLEDQISSSQISMTYHQLLEIYHALGFLGLKLPLDFVRRYCSILLQAAFMKWYEISSEIMENALKLSAESGIHVWDFACILPLYKDITIMYSCDKHFTHISIQSLGIPIKNPVSKWFTL